MTAQHKHTRFWTASILKCHKNNMGSNAPGMPQSCHRPWLAGASSSMKSNWLCSTMTAASSRDLETYSRLLGAVLKVWSFKATISYNKFSLLTDSKLSMYLFSTEGRWTCCLPVIRKIRWIKIPYIMPGLSDLDPFACLNIFMNEFKSSCITPEVGPCCHRAGQQSRVQSSGDFLAVASLQQIELPLRMSAL